MLQREDGLSPLPGLGFSFLIISLAKELQMCTDLCIFGRDCGVEEMPLS